MSLYRVTNYFCHDYYVLGDFDTLAEAQAFVEQFVKGSSGKWVSRHRWVADDKQDDLSIALKS